MIGFAKTKYWEKQWNIVVPHVRIIICSQSKMYLERYKVWITSAFKTPLRNVPEFQYAVGRIEVEWFNIV